MTTDTPVLVALRNDYEIVVEGLAQMLAPFSERVALVELDSGAPVARPADVVLYDTFGQPQGEHLDISSLQVGPARAKVIIYTWALEATLAATWIDRGAAACLSKGLPAPVLVDAIERVHAGERLVLPAPAGENPRGRWPGRSEGLSEREAEVVALIAEGLSNEAIAGRTHLSINSVKSYIRSAYRKIGVDSRSQAVLWGVDHGLLAKRSRRPGPDEERFVLP
ncbi:response regulator transcription factor [Isoptericola sp. b441]|uniref:Response regulator transcription factor n=1 Tax=Actinotalea lenta TaxID=3064654 RepID=A0ABT9D8Y0_9CELL|nr:response regulator transcription factor [Isoptericola sp. b441]MDO8107020.1 response regulator transcription factor [Isoptericola sp. b441]